MNLKKRYAMTLIEIMLVMVLVAVVGGALAFNLKGSLDKGKAFKTEQMHKKIEAILSIEASQEDPDVVLNQWEKIVSQSPLIKIKHANGAIVDAWGSAFKVELDTDNNRFLVSSDHIDINGHIGR